jgi:hypothetical protein
VKKNRQKKKVLQKPREQQRMHEPPTLAASIRTSRTLRHSV